MGGLKKWMPITFSTFIIGWLAISGIFPFSGFWSKDDILAAAYGSHGQLGKVLWAAGFITAGLTAYYMSRQVALVFLGQGRWNDAAHPAEGDSGVAAKPGLTQAEPVAQEVGDTTQTSGHGAHGDPHESPWTMATPLVILGFLALVGGAINLPWGKADLLTRWLAPVFPAAIAPEPHVDTAAKVTLAVLTLALCIGGLVLGLVPWLRTIHHPKLEPAVLRHGWYYDEAISALVAGPGEEAANFAAYSIDKGVIDGAVNGVAVLTRGTGSRLRRLQTGYVRNYALGIAGGSAALLLYATLNGWFIR